MEEQRFTNAQEFIAHLRRSAPHWTDSGAGAAGSLLLFRGQASARWRLEPSAFRLPFPKLTAPLFDMELAGLLKNRNQCYEPDPADRAFKELEAYEQFAIMERVLGRTVCEFVRRAHVIGDPAGSAIESGALQGTGMSPGTPIERGQESCPCFFQNNEGADAVRAVMEVAQHYLLPTYLLDWTVSPLVAAYYASLHGEDDDIAVYALHLENFSPMQLTDSSLAFAVVPAGNTQNRMARAQYSWFSAFAIGFAREFYAAHGVYPSVEDGAKLAAREGRFANIHLNWYVPPFKLMKFVLERSEVTELRRLLRLEGIDGTSVKPGLDGVVEALRAEWLDRC